MGKWGKTMAVSRSSSPSPTPFSCIRDGGLISLLLFLFVIVPCFCCPVTGAHCVLPFSQFSRFPLPLEEDAHCTLPSGALATRQWLWFGCTQSRAIAIVGSALAARASPPASSKPRGSGGDLRPVADAAAARTAAPTSPASPQVSLSAGGEAPFHALQRCHGPPCEHQQANNEME